MSEPFGFEVSPAGAGRLDYEPEENWCLALPHQCDSWMIASEPDPAVFFERIARFRAELNSAIRKLEQAAGVRECGMKCGEWVRPVQPSDGVDGYQMVHLSGNPICPVTAEAC